MTRTFFVLSIVLLGVGCTPQCEKSHFEPSEPLSKPLLDFKVEEIEAGGGAKLKEGDVVEVHYRAWLYDSFREDKKGTMVGDSFASNSPLRFKYGVDEAIAGWTDGLRGIKAGGKRRLFIPSAMAYGESGAGSQIPPGAQLIYEIEVVAINPTRTD